jgi:shikimate kinase
VHLLLIGLFSSGKSTVGKKVATALNLPFYDSDHFLEEKLGESCRSYFQREKEEAFRIQEFEVIQQILNLPAGVLSVGGGAPSYPPTFHLLLQCPVRVYLEYSLETILQEFPIRGIPPFVSSLEEVYHVRHPVYHSLSTAQINCNKKRMQDVVDKIVETSYSSVL